MALLFSEDSNKMNLLCSVLLSIIVGLARVNIVGIVCYIIYMSNHFLFPSFHYNYNHSCAPIRSFIHSLSLSMH